MNTKQHFCTCCKPPQGFTKIKARNGHMGKTKSQITQTHNKQIRIQEYLLSPTFCKQCNTFLSYMRKNESFCSHSCAATYNNTRKDRKHPLINCKNCNQPTTTETCSPACRVMYRWNQQHLPRLLSGQIKHRPTLRRYLIKTHGHQCQICSGTTWLNKPTPLELDHIDGNATNNFLSNLRIICPNCHAFTPTYKAKNKGNGRQFHGLRSV